MLRLTIGVVCAVCVGTLIADQIQARDRFDHARRALGVTRQHTVEVSAVLSGVRRNLELLTSQVGDEATALNQDASQLTGAEAALTAAQTHVSQQASRIDSLQTCLGGVERALNALSVDDRSGAIAALEAVSTSCTAASAADG